MSNPIAYFCAAHVGVRDVVIDAEFPGEIFACGVLVELLQIIDISECMIA